MASQALASLTATYTDSEGEEDMEEGQTTPDNNLPSPISVSAPTSPSRKLVEDFRQSSAPVSPKPTMRLVSYNDDTVVSDDEPSLVSTEDDMRRISIETDTDDYQRNEGEEIEEGIIIPPEPNGKCPIDLQDKITTFYNRMKTEGMDMNKVIQDRKSFRNPSIYEKLILYCNINELDTNYPPETYDPLRWGKESYYDELAKVQRAEVEKLEKSRKEKVAKIALTSNVSKKVESADDAKKRKSKWDQAAPSASGSKATVQPAGLAAPSLTTAITGTKGTVISAFGSLPKKSKV